ncbi:hypothetical protein DSO57_1016264 [Entomophthora muscae]|uniref:Uncharacterized protein n=1 Tax=Entomophthora muscae TaxID=34485 RepID=A0ACC2TSK2_9FUNG|nr:hypothetical protein DSO57_1016264 [Entomophthora muscae]
MNLGLLTMAPILLLLWPTFPELLACLSSSTISVANSPGRLLYMLNDLPGKTCGLLSAGESLMRSLTSDDEPPFAMKVLDAFGELQLCLSDNSSSLNTPTLYSKQLVALLDSLDDDACMWALTLLFCARSWVIPPHSSLWSLLQYLPQFQGLCDL